MKKLRWFTARDFMMDGKDVSGKMDDKFLDQIDECREDSGVPFFVTSSYRTKAKNQAVGGAANSLHLKGRAVDVRCTDGATRAKIITAALNLGLSVGIMENAIHIDNRETQIVFHYYRRYGKE